MKKLLVRLICGVMLLIPLLSLVPESAQGQTQPLLVRPGYVYRFNISSSDGGYFLTGKFQEGILSGYIPPLLHMQHLGIWMPPAGFTPDPTAGLVPLHRWLVIQGGWRNYYYYSTGFANLGGDYHYYGIAGYVLPPGQSNFRGLPLTQLSSYYSITKGYWNGSGVAQYDASRGIFIEPPPPGEGYQFQGTVCSMVAAIQGTQFPVAPVQGPLTMDVVFFPPAPPPPPPPPGSCGTPGLISKCSRLGGSWNPETCECEY